MRLRFVEEVSFGKSEQTNFLEFSAKNESLAKNLSSEDAILFVSKTGNQLVFIHGFTVLDSKTKVLSSRRLRLSGGKWNPLRLANYATEVGVTLDGIKRFEQYY